jgi:hypothetical protein
LVERARAKDGNSKDKKEIKIDEGFVKNPILT